MPYERALVASRQDHVIGQPEPQPRVRGSGVLADAAHGVIARLDGGGVVDGCEVPPWFGCEWLMDAEDGGLRACLPNGVDRSRGEVMCGDDDDHEYMAMTDDGDGDNVYGCVRELVVDMGEEGYNSGLKECRGLPRSGERVVLCDRSECPCPFPHPADPGSLYPVAVRDGVSGGVSYRTSTCHRTCSGCGVTWVSRVSRTKHMWMCGGCHAPTPFLKSGPGEPDDVTRLLGVLVDGCPVYCGEKCQAMHWDRDHHEVCRRFDQWFHAAVVSKFALEVDAHGDDIPVTEYGVPRGEGTMPFLVPASRLQPGLSSGWGYA